MQNVTKTGPRLRPLLAPLQRHPRAILVAALAAGRGVGDEDQSADRECVDPTPRADAAEVLRARVPREIFVAHRGGTEQQQVLGGGDLAAAVGAREVERLIVTGQ